VVANYLTNITCTTCGLSLLRSPKTAVNPIVFCAECRSGGHYDDVIVEHKELTPEFVTLGELDEMLSAIGSESD
jgi:hypothetical protein